MNGIMSCGLSGRVALVEGRESVECGKKRERCRSWRVSVLS